MQTVGVEIDKKGLIDHCAGAKTTQKGQRAHEHYRTRQAISPVAERVSPAYAMGLESVSLLWGYGDDQTWELYQKAVVFGWAESSEGSAA